MAASLNIWRKYGVLRNEYIGDSWFAQILGISPTAPGSNDHLRFFDDRGERDQFIKDHNRLIKIYGFEEYSNIYKTLMT